MSIDGIWTGNRIDYHLYPQLACTCNTALSLIYTFYSSPLHTHKCSQSSLVVSWQRIYNSLTVTAAHTKSSFHILIPFLPSLLNHPRLPSQETSSIRWIYILPESESESESELLNDWWFTANQFILAPSPMRPTTSISFFNWTLAVIVLT
jgi:hypothetical protein